MAKKLQKRKARLEERRKAHAGVGRKDGYRQPGSMNGRK